MHISTFGSVHCTRRAAILPPSLAFSTNDSIYIDYGKEVVGEYSARNAGSARRA
jgi:hypothetical protein